MGRVGLWMIGIVAFLALPETAARAADMPGYPALPFPLPASEGVPQIEEFISGWYLRGDLGYRFQQVQGASDPTSVPLHSNCHSLACFLFRG